MSGGKKKHPKAQFYSESELRRSVKDAGDQAVARILLLCLIAARDEFDLDEDGTVRFMDTMQRYIRYHKQGIISMDEASDALKRSTGIDLRLSRW